KSHAYQLASADGSITRLKSIDVVTGKISWIEQLKNTDAALRLNLIGSSSAFTADDEVVEVKTYDRAFEQAGQVLKSHAYQLASADGSITRLKSIDVVTGKISWIEQLKNTDAALRLNLIGSSSAFTADDEVVEVKTYDRAFDQAGQVLKSHAYQLASADGSITRLKSIDVVTGKISWIEQLKNTDAALRLNLIGNS